MQPDGIRAIGGSGREHTGERILPLVARVHLEHVSVAQVKPREEKDFIALGKAGERNGELRQDFDPSFGSALVSLTGGFVASLERERMLPMGFSL